MLPQSDLEKLIPNPVMFWVRALVMILAIGMTVGYYVTDFVQQKLQPTQSKVSSASGTDLELLFVKELTSLEKDLSAKILLNNQKLVEQLRDHISKASVVREDLLDRVHELDKEVIYLKARLETHTDSHLKD